MRFGREIFRAATGDSGRAAAALGGSAAGASRPVKNAGRTMPSGPPRSTRNFGGARRDGAPSTSITPALVAVPENSGRGTRQQSRPQVAYPGVMKSVG